MCVIDEYAIIVRRWTWFMPMAPPTRAFTAPKNNKILEDAPVRINEIIDNGASFCQVDKIKQESQEIDVITDGYHRWHGAIPIFSRTDIISKNLILFIGIEFLNHMEILAINIILDPKAWAIKYLIEASVSWLEFDIIINGINERRFSSIPAHRKIQLALDMAIAVLITITSLHIKLNGVNIIKIRRSRTAQFKLEALFARPILWCSL
jgi:hypothetical protein